MRRKAEYRRSWRGGPLQALQCTLIAHFRGCWERRKECAHSIRLPSCFHPSSDPWYTLWKGSPTGAFNYRIEWLHHLSTNTVHIAQVDFLSRAITTGTVAAHQSHLLQDKSPDMSWPFTASPVQDAYSEAGAALACCFVHYNVKCFSSFPVIWCNETCCYILQCCSMLQQLSWKCVSVEVAQQLSASCF